MGEKKKLRLILPSGTSIIQHLYGGDIGAKTTETVIEFDEDVLRGRHLNGFINDLFDQFLILEVSELKYFLPKMIRILEERFEFIITVCGNCRYYRGVPGLSGRDGLCWEDKDELKAMKDEDLIKNSHEFPFHGCAYGVAKDKPARVNCYSRCIKDWAPKEVSDEISMKRYCSKCDEEVEIKIKRGNNPFYNPLSANCPKCQGEIRLRHGCGAKL